MGQQAHERELGKCPGVRRTDHGIDARLAELTANDIGLRLAVNQDRRPDDIYRLAVRSADLGGDQVGEGLDNIACPLPRGLVDARIACADNADGDVFWLGFSAR